MHRKTVYAIEYRNNDRFIHRFEKKYDRAMFITAVVVAGNRAFRATSNDPAIRHAVRDRTVIYHAANDQQ